MERKIYLGKFYHGEESAPKMLSKDGQFFWEYERAFHSTSENPTPEKFNIWLENMFTDYFPYKMMSAPLTDEESVIREWRERYRNA